MAEVKRELPHSIVLENRSCLRISGVTDVGTFDEQIIRTVTSMGGLIVRGKRLHISQLSLESGELRIDGEIHALQYTESVHRPGNGLARIFR